jgi:hypothetical protein
MYWGKGKLHEEHFLQENLYLFNQQSHSYKVKDLQQIKLINK